uniref:PXMP2/4 family protein 4 n=1 Tax=Vitis vinifera TaxID=29760 RepID=F6GZN2_VITVI
MGSGYVRIIGKWQQPWKIKTSTPSSFASVHQLRNIRNSEISRPINLLSSRSFSSSSSRSSKIGFLGWYLGMLETSPLITKSVTSSLIFAAADLTSQKIMLPPSGSFDPIRTLRMTGYGLLILGPSQHLWFNFVAKVLPKRDVITTLKKIIMGQAIFGPCINSVFFSVNAALQGESGDEIVARLKRDLLPTQLNGLLYWPICDFVTFRFVPVHLQPLMNSSCSYLWTIYLTYMASLRKEGGGECGE